jgi:hypothetical protein
MGGEKRQSLAMKRCAQAEKREATERLKTISKLLKEAQYDFNRFIRERDHALGCISCDAPVNYDGQWTAGHYRTTKAAAHLRFNEDNCAKQCGQCNHHKSGNIAEFRVRLVERIGAARVELLEDDNRTLKWSREEIIAIRKQYAAKWKALKAARA